jgi:hypothetical protein
VDRRSELPGHRLQCRPNSAAEVDAVPKLNTSIAEALRSGDQKRAKDYEENGPKLSIFGERNHGVLLQIAGSRRNAVQYEIGNPLTASKMTRHRSPPLSTRRCGYFCSRMSTAGQSSNMTGHRLSLASMAMSAYRRWGGISTPLSKLFCATLPTNGGELRAPPAPRPQSDHAVGYS